MADSETTGSSVICGTVGGLNKGMPQLAGAATPRDMTDKVLYVYGSPQNVVTVSIGSQLAYDVENADIYCGLGQNGSTWNRLGSMT